MYGNSVWCCIGAIASVSVGVNVAVAVGVLVGVAVAVGVLVGVEVAVGVLVGVEVAVGVLVDIDGAGIAQSSQPISTPAAFIYMSDPNKTMLMFESV